MEDRGRWGSASAALSAAAAASAGFFCVPLARTISAAMTRLPIAAV